MINRQSVVACLALKLYTRDMLRRIYQLLGLTMHVAVFLVQHQRNEKPRNWQIRSKLASMLEFSFDPLLFY